MGFLTTIAPAEQHIYRKNLRITNLVIVCTRKTAFHRTGVSKRAKHIKLLRSLYGNGK